MTGARDSRIPSSLQLLHDRLERSTMAVLAGQEAQRAVNIAQTPMAVPRVLDVWMLRAVSLRPSLIARGLRRGIPISVSVVGSGSNHTVVHWAGQGDGTVAKIYRPSVFMSTLRQEALALEFNRLHGILREYLGDVVLPQSTDVHVHPLNPIKTAVVSVQRLTAFERIDVFRAHEPAIDQRALLLALNRHPWMTDALVALQSSAVRMYEDTGLLLDCSGMDNLVVTGHESPRLTCLDGLPIATGNVGDTRRILGQLTALREALMRR